MSDLSQRLRDQIAAHREAFEPPQTYSLELAVVKGYDRATGRYVLQQAGSSRIAESQSNGALPQGIQVAAVNGVDVMPHRPLVQPVPAQVRREPSKCSVKILSGAYDLATDEVKLWISGDRDEPELIAVIPNPTPDIVRNMGIFRNLGASPGPLVNFVVSDFADMHVFGNGKDDWIISIYDEYVVSANSRNYHFWIVQPNNFTRYDELLPALIGNVNTGISSFALSYIYNTGVGFLYTLIERTADNSYVFTAYRVDQNGKTVVVSDYSPMLSGFTSQTRSISFYGRTFPDGNVRATILADKVGSELTIVGFNLFHNTTLLNDYSDFYSGPFGAIVNAVSSGPSGILSADGASDVNNLYRNKVFKYLAASQEVSILKVQGETLSETKRKAVEIISEPTVGQHTAVANNYLYKAFCS